VSLERSYRYSIDAMDENKEMMEEINRMNKDIKYSGGEKITLWIIVLLIVAYILTFII
jgi:hypothetical protein